MSSCHCKMAPMVLLGSKVGDHCSWMRQWGIWSENMWMIVNYPKWGWNHEPALMFVQCQDYGLVKVLVYVYYFDVCFFDIFICIFISISILVFIFIKKAIILVQCWRRMCSVLHNGGTFPLKDMPGFIIYNVSF